MKRIGLCILFIQTIIIANAQQVSFYKTFSETSELIFNGITSVHDGGYAIAGYQYGANGGDYFLLKVDSGGNEIWRRRNNVFTQNYDSSNQAFRIKETLDKGFVIIGELWNTSSKGIYIARTDSMGNKIWDKNYFFQYSSQVSDILVNDDSTFTLIGQKTIVPFQQYNLLILKVNKVGDTLFTRDLSFNPYSFIGNKFYQYNNQYYLYGSAVNLSISPLNKSSLVVLDSSFNYLNNWINNDTMSSHVISAYTLSDGSVNVVCLTDVPGGISYTARLDSTLSLSSNINLFTPGMVGSFQDSSNFIFSYPNIYTSKGNMNADTLWQQFTFEEFATPFDLIINHNRFSVQCGHIKQDQSTNSIGYILMIEDSISPDYISGCVGKQEGFVTIVPNPFTDKATVIIDESIIKNYKQLDLEFFDITGKLCKRYPSITSQKTEIEKGNLKPCTYNYVLTKNHIKVFSGKIILN